MTIQGEPRVWLSQLPLGEPQPFSCDYQGIHYPGEVVRANSWFPQWGEPLTGDAYFRIVLLQEPIADPPNIQDSRIAVCVPGVGQYRQRDRLADELATIRQAQTLYLTQRDPEADLIRRTLQSRQESLEEELMSQELNRYSSGAVLVAPEQQSPPDYLIAGPDPATWFHQIAQWLLQQGYPSSPLDVARLPRPVTHQDVVALYRSLYQGNDNAVGLLEELGPGLGLTSPQSSGQVSPESCPVLELISGYLESSAEPAAWPELHNYLAHQVGLTCPLATLYLLVFLDQHAADYEVRLSSQHHLFLTDGRPLTGSRLTADLLPALIWDDRLAYWATSIGPITQPDWNDALPYLAGICPELSPADTPADLAVQEARLLREVGQMARDLEISRQFLAMVDRRLGTSLEASRRLSQALDRLSGISGSNFQTVYHTVRRAYTDHRVLEQDMALFRQLSQLGRFGQQVQNAWRYLDNAAVPPEMADLSLEKQGLEAALSPASLLRFSRSWRTLSHQIDNFKEHYAVAYRVHHQHINQSLPSYEYQRTNGRLKLRALELLNTVSDLGEPAGMGLLQEMTHLDPRLSRCPGEVQVQDLQDNPWCGLCHLTLEQTLPEEALSRLMVVIDAELEEKNRRLSNLLVERIIHGQADQHLEDFLKIVQASDLSALSNTINEELVSFIRRVLA